MDEGWIENRDEGQDWLEVIDWDGNALGWVRRFEAVRMGLRFHTIETPKRYLEDPYIRNHSELAYERGILNRGNDLNDVQITLLLSHLSKKREFEENLRIRSFEEALFTSNPELYKTYMDHKRQQAEVQEDTVAIEERAPQSIEEFLQVLEAFSEDGGSDSDKEKVESEGWLSSLLSDDELEQMGEDD